MNQSMQAITCPVYGPPEVLQPTSIPVPTPAKGEILVKVVTSTVAVADVRLRAFDVPKAAWIPARLAIGLRRPRRPVLGVEFSGVVAALGEGVQRFQVGDEVFGESLKYFGAYAEYLCAPEDGPVALRPANLPLADAAALPIGAGTAVYFLDQAGLRAGQRILIYGASGSVGTYAVQYARHLGAEITAVCSAANHELVRSLGAQKALDYQAPDFLEQLGQYDVVFLAIDKLPFAECNRILVPGGTYVNITNPLPGFGQLRTSLFGGKRIIMGKNSPPKPAKMLRIKELVEQGVLQPVIDRRFPMAQIRDAHAYVDRGHKKGNVVVEVGGI